MLPRFPRSVLSCLARLEECLASLATAAVSLDRPRRRAGLLRARLELGEIEASMASDPVPVLSRLADDLVELAGEVLTGVVRPLAGPPVHPQYLRPRRGLHAVRLDISYRVHFRYAEAVSESQNEIRMQPRDGEHQRVLSYSLACDPPAEVLHARDYWGTAVDHLGVRAPHKSLQLVADASVETLSRPAPENDCAVAALGDPDFRSQHFEFLEPSEHVAWEPGDAVARHAAEACAGAASVPLLASLIAYRVRQTLAYVSGSTAIGVSLAELLEGRQGVCQDFAHLAIGMLRSVGVPARYVSGYLFAADETVAPPDSEAPRGDAGTGDRESLSGGSGFGEGLASASGRQWCSRPQQRFGRR